MKHEKLSSQNAGCMLSPKPGDVIDGHRIVTPNIAQGGSGVVHEALDPQGRRCALKVLHREKLLSLFRERIKSENGNEENISDHTEEKYKTYIQMFKDEYQKLVGLIHPHVAKAYHFGFHEGHFYFSSEFIEGKPIATYLQHAEPRAMVPLFVQALEGLDFLHKSGLIHLDVKSENVLVQDINGKPQVKIIDLGLSMTPEEYGGQYFGSTHYIAPEVALGEKEKVDAKADLFSFAVLMYVSLSHGISYPFPRTAKKDPKVIQELIRKEKLRRLPSSFYRQEPEKYPEFLDTLLHHLLEREPENRFYPTARAVINALLSGSPDCFEMTDERASYLVPEGNQHVGREKIREKIRSYIQGIISEKKKQAPLLFIEGNEGLGKTHLLQKCKERVSLETENIHLHHISFPSDDDVSIQWEENLSQVLSQSEKPIVVLIDNLHELYADEEKRKDTSPLFHLETFIERLFLLVHDRNKKAKLFEETPPLLICATYDPKYFSGEQFLGALNIKSEFEMLKLEPLSYLEVLDYLKLTPAFKGRELPLERVDLLYQQTNGIPAELREQLEVIDSHGVLFDLEGNILLGLVQKETRSIAPRTQARLFEQYQQCDIEEARILKFMSVWNWKHLAPAASYNDIFNFLPLLMLKQKLNELVRKEILLYDVDKSTYNFRNKDFLPSLVYRSMPQEERSYWHEQIYHFLVEQNLDGDLRLLHKAFRKGDAQTYKAIYQLASKKIKQEMNIPLAVELCEHALNIIPKEKKKLRFCFSFLLADAYRWLGNSSKAEEFSLETFQSIESEKIWKIKFLLQLAALSLSKKNYNKSSQFLHDAKKLFSKKHFLECPTPLSLSLLNLEAQYHYELGRNSTQADVDLKKAKFLFEAAKVLEAKLPEENRSRVHNNLGFVLRHLGEFESAIRVFSEELSKFKKEKQLSGIIETSLYMANCYRLLRQYDEALRYAEKSLDLAQKAKQGKWLELAYNILATIYHDSDKFELALKANDHYLAAAALQKNEREYKQCSIVCWGSKGRCYKELHQFNKAILHFQEVIHLGAEPMYLMGAYQGLGSSYYQKGELEKSNENLQHAEIIMDQLPAKAVEAYRFPVSLMRARIFFQQGKIDEAHKVLLRVKPLIQKNRKWKMEFEKVVSEIDVETTVETT